MAGPCNPISRNHPFMSSMMEYHLMHGGQDPIRRVSVHHAAIVGSRVYLTNGMKTYPVRHRTSCSPPPAATGHPRHVGASDCTAHRRNTGHSAEGGTVTMDEKQGLPTANDVDPGSSESGTHRATHGRCDESWDASRVYFSKPTFLVSAEISLDLLKYTVDARRERHPRGAEEHSPVPWQALNRQNAGQGNKECICESSLPCLS